MLTFYWGDQKSLACGHGREEALGLVMNSAMKILRSEKMWVNI